MPTDKFHWMRDTYEELSKCPKCEGPVEKNILKLSYKNNKVDCSNDNWACRKCETIWLIGTIEIDR